MAFGKSKAQLAALTRGQLEDELVRVMREADLVDERRRVQVANQIASINRLLDNPSGVEEIASLNDQLATAVRRGDRAEQKLQTIREIFHDQKTEPRTTERPDATILFRALKDIMEVVDNG